MKKFFLALAFVAASVALYANPICYFTYGQARRTVHFLNTQDELVIYCGHQFELETYVIVSDIWMERVSSRYYEIWLYGIDAYTGDEIYMPIDLSCIWLLDRWTNSMYNAARYLHFQIDAPFTTLVWTMPAYTGFVRVAHPAYYHRSYHYDIHRHGWRPAPEVGLPVYYMRPPTAPMPVIANPYVPGRERPVVHVDNTLPSRPQPTTSRTTSTPVRNVNPTPTNNNGNRPPADPAVNGGGNNHDTRTSGTSDRNTSSSNSGGTTGRTPSTSTNNNMNPTPTPGSNTGRTPSTSTTRPTTTPTSTTTPSRTTTSQPRTSSSDKPSTTTTTPNRNTSQPRTTSTNTRPSNTATKTTSTSTNNRNTSSSTSGSRNTNNTNNGKATSTTTRTSSSSRR